MKIWHLLYIGVLYFTQETIKVFWKETLVLEIHGTCTYISFHNRCYWYQVLVQNTCTSYEATQMNQKFEIYELVV